MQFNKNEWLLVSDLDGTLLPKHPKLTHFAFEQLVKLIEDGLQFTVASARGIKTIQQVLGPLPLKLPVIGMNGATISHFDTGEHIKVFHLNEPHVQAVFEIGDELNLAPFVSTVEPSKDGLYYDDVLNFGMRWYINNRIQARDKRLKRISTKYDFSKSVTTLTFIAAKDQIIDLSYRLKEQLGTAVNAHFYENQYSPGWWWLNVIDAQTSKGNAVKWLMKNTTNLPQQLMCFGDNYNDVSMFEVADWSVATENAVPELLQIADKVIGHHYDDSTIKHIMQF